MIIELSSALIQSVNAGKCKAVDVILFLLDNGFTSYKKPSETSLQELMFEGSTITKVVIDPKGYAHIDFKK